MRRLCEGVSLLQSAEIWLGRNGKESSVVGNSMNQGLREKEVLVGSGGEHGSGVGRLRGRESQRK